MFDLAEGAFSFLLFGEYMKIFCNECGDRAITTKTLRHSNNAYDIYLICKSCGHRFVWSAGFKHSITETNSNNKEKIKYLIESTPESERRELLDELKSFLVS